MVGMKAIVPKSLAFDAAKINRAVENALSALAEDIAADFDTTVQTWRNPPDFAIAKRPGERIISTSDRIYGYVTRGTKPHVIVPRRAKMLRFAAGSKPKTAVRVIGSGGGSTGSTIVYTRRVQHPGTQARGFDVVIAEKWKKRAPQVLQRAIDSEVR